MVETLDLCIIPQRGETPKNWDKLVKIKKGGQRFLVVLVDISMVRWIYKPTHITGGPSYTYTILYNWSVQNPLSSLFSDFSGCLIWFPTKECDSPQYFLRTPCIVINHQGCSSHCSIETYLNCSPHSSVCLQFRGTPQIPMLIHYFPCELHVIFAG